MPDLSDFIIAFRLGGSVLPGAATNFTITEAKMPFCRKCNIEYEEGKKFCKKCGTPLTVQEKINQAEAKTQQARSASSHSDKKVNIQANSLYPRTISAKQKINKYLVLLYFITAGIHFFLAVIFYYRQEPENPRVPFMDFALFTIILICGFFLSKRKPSHLAINITFFLLLLFYIIYLINIICKFVFFSN